MDIARQRLHNERLIGTPFEKPEDVVQWLGAVQAQDYAGAKWGIGQRIGNCLDANVEQAYLDGKILRTHVMRPTWHFVMPDEIRWMQALTAPRVHKVNGPIYRRLELDDVLLRRSHAAIRAALHGDRHLTRAELGGVLEQVGIRASGQRLAYIIMHAELDALICSGELRGKQHTYALLEERALKARALTRDEALAELTRRYFTGHGPALVHDFAWWSGLTVADARAGVEMARSHLVQEVVDEKTYWFAPRTSTTRVKDATIQLLPNYDEYLIAYKDYSPVSDASRPIDSAVLNDVLARHIIVINGKVAGGWRRTLAKNEVVVETKLLVAHTQAQQRALHAAAQRYGRFLGKSVTMRPGEW